MQQSEVRPPAPVAPQPQPPVAPQPRPARRRYLVGSLGLQGGVSWGALPGVGGGFDLTGGLSGRRWRWDLIVGHQLPRRARYTEQPDVGGRFSAISGGSRGCGVPQIWRFEFPLCLGLDLGAIRARSEGTPQQDTVWRLWLATRTDLSTRVRLRRSVAIGLEASVLVPLLRPGFALESLGVLHRVGPVVVRGLLVVELRFGQWNKRAAEKDKM